MTADGSRRAGAAPPAAVTSHRIEDRRIVLQRVIHAPRDLVFLAWTDPVHIARWWGPHGFRSVVRQMDVATGGEFRICMVGPDGAEYPLRGRYQELVAPERLVYWVDWDDPARPPQPSLNRVSLSARSDGHTEVTLELEFASAGEREDVQTQQVVPGWGECFERLDAYLAER
ncbi:SRPBCC domain-containing protein [Lysobacter firmicutimachus]|uniref:SRPBCC domain-containing protein n=3 Tax=Lysobacter TaxID=68 RepID=A0AAU8MWZ6_9GAMM